ncbi:hypothetical protein MRX96_029431 [Rhipicephalus microplus]
MGLTCRRGFGRRDLQAAPTCQQQYRPGDVEHEASYGNVRHYIRRGEAVPPKAGHDAADWANIQHGSPPACEALFDVLFSLAPVSSPDAKYISALQVWAHG